MLFRSYVHWLATCKAMYINIFGALVFAWAIIKAGQRAILATILYFRWESLKGLTAGRAYQSLLFAFTPMLSTLAFSIAFLATILLPLAISSWDELLTAGRALNCWDRLLSGLSSTLTATVFGRTSLCCKRLAAVGTFLFKWHDKILLAQDSCWQVLTLGAGPLPVPDFSTRLYRPCLSPIGIIPQFQSVATGG